jgi:hypothetical protein
VGVVVLPRHEGSEKIKNSPWHPHPQAASAMSASVGSTNRESGFGEFAVLEFFGEPRPINTGAPPHTAVSSLLMLRRA